MILSKLLYRLIQEIQVFLLKKICTSNSYIIADIGASSLEGGLLYRASKNIKTIAFDPGAHARRTESSPSLGIVDWYNFAISDKNDNMDFYVTRKRHCSSLLKPLEETNNYFIDNIIKVPCRTLDSLQIDYDYLKVDVQGAEYSVLSGAKKSLNSCSGIKIEVWFEKVYEGQSKLDDLFSMLKEIGFSFVGFSDLYSVDNRISFGDAIFVKFNNTKSNDLLKALLLIETCSEIYLKNLFNDLNIYKKFILTFVVFIGSLKPKVGYR